MKPGDLVQNHPMSFSKKLFSAPIDERRVGDRGYRGTLRGVGLVLEIRGSDVRILSGETEGWCYVGNLELVE